MIILVRIEMIFIPLPIPLFAFHEGYTITHTSLLALSLFFSFVFFYGTIIFGRCLCQVKLDIDHWLEGWRDGQSTFASDRETAKDEGIDVVDEFDGFIDNDIRQLVVGLDALLYDGVKSIKQADLSNFSRSWSDATQDWA